MVCYIVPTAVALVHGLMRKNMVSLKNNVHHLWLNLLLVGATIFGFFDYWWNGELFFVGENTVLDILLGVIITIAVFVVWILFVIIDKSKTTKLMKA